jgi:hypothetical protein
MGSFRAWASRLVELVLYVHNSRGWRSQLRPSSLVVVSDVGYIAVTAVYKGLGGLWVAYPCFLKCSLSRSCKRRNPIMVERQTMTDGFIDYSASSPWFCDYQYRQTHRNSSSMSILRGRAPVHRGNVHYGRINSITSNPWPLFCKSSVDCLRSLLYILFDRLLRTIHVRTFSFLDCSQQYPLSTDLINSGHMQSSCVCVLAHLTPHRPERLLSSSPTQLKTRVSVAQTTGPIGQNPATIGER